MYKRFLRQERQRHEKENINSEQQNSMGIFEITEAVVPSNGVKQKNRSNSLKTFIPFIQERDSIGRLIGVIFQLTFQVFILLKMSEDHYRKSARSINENISRISPLLKSSRKLESSPPPVRIVRITFMFIFQL